MRESRFEAFIIPLRPRSRHAISWALLLLCLLMLPLDTVSAEDPEVPPLKTLEKAFRSRDPEAIRSLLRGPAKIFVASPALGMKPGYYSPDQIYFMVRDRFRACETIRFDLNKSDRTPDKVRRVNAVGRWLYRYGARKETWAEITFTLVRRNDSWCLQEIRERL